MMLVAKPLDKMFKKDKTKSTEIDVSYLEDAWEYLKNASANEGHITGNAMISFVQGNDKETVRDLQKLSEARKMRKQVGDIISTHVKKQNWCRVSKHIPLQAMTCQELISRHLSLNEYEQAKKLLETYERLYRTWLEELGVTEKNAKMKTEA